MFLTFVDGSQASDSAISEIGKIEPKYRNLLSFYIADNQRWSHLKRVLGITWDEVPSMAFHMLDKTIIPYPKGKPILKDEMFKWFDDVVSGKAVDSVKTGDYHSVINDHDIYETNLKHTIFATRMNFTYLTLEEGYDAVALLYTTEFLNEDQRKDATEFNIAAEIL